MRRGAGRGRTPASGACRPAAPRRRRGGRCSTATARRRGRSRPARRSPRGRRARGRGRRRATRRRRPRRCRRRPCRGRRAPAPTPPRPSPTRGRVRPLRRSRTKTSERASPPRASALNASRRPSAESRGSESSSDIPGGAGTARSRPLRRSRTHDAGAAARLVRAVVGLVGDQPPVARDRRVVGRARDRELGRVADLDRAAAAQVAGQDLHAPVALREVEVAERGLERDPAPVGRQRRVVVRARVGRLAAREHGRRAGADGARHHRDLAEPLGDRELGLVALEHDAPAVGRQRRVVGVVRRRGRRGARRVHRRRAVVARLLQPARELAQLAREQPLGLHGRDRLARDALVGVLAQRRRRLLLRVPAREAVEAADLQRAELGAPQRRPLRAARDAEDLGRVRGDRLLVQRVEEQVLGEVALGQRAQRPALEQREPLGVAQLAPPRRDELARERGRLPSLLLGELGEVARVVAQHAPDRAAVDAEQRVEPPLVVGQPVLHHPPLAGQPVRRRARRRVGVQRHRLRLGGKLHLRRRRASRRRPGRRGSEPACGRARMRPTLHQRAKSAGPMRSRWSATISDSTVAVMRSRSSLRTARAIGSARESSASS